MSCLIQACIKKYLRLQPTWKLLLWRVFTVQLTVQTLTCVLFSWSASTKVFPLQLNATFCRKMWSNSKTSSNKSWLWLTFSMGQKVTCFECRSLLLKYSLTVWHTDNVSFCTGNFIELFSQKLQRNELILRDELKLLLHLCQTAEDVVVARDAIYRWSSFNKLVSNHPCRKRQLFFRTAF